MGDNHMRVAKSSEDSHTSVQWWCSVDAGQMQCSSYTRGHSVCVGVIHPSFFLNDPRLASMFVSMSLHSNYGYVAEQVRKWMCVRKRAIWGKREREREREGMFTGQDEWWGWTRGHTRKLQGSVTRGAYGGVLSEHLFDTQRRTLHKTPITR